MKPLFMLVLMLSLTLAGENEDQRIAKARRVHDKVLTIDTHCDTAMSLDRFDVGQRHEPKMRGSGKQDFVRMKEGGLDASFFAVFVPQGELTPSAYVRAKASAITTLDALDKVFAAYPQLAQCAVDANELTSVVNSGKRAILLGLENGYPIGDDLKNLDFFFSRGIRYVTLCHSHDNQFCDSATDDLDPQDRGLRDLGKELVRRMNDLGVLIDTSHISEKSFFDVLAVTRVPVFASHSSCRALCSTPRNFSDEMLKALKANGGVIQICVLSEYLKAQPANPERDQAMAVLRRKVMEKYGSWASINDPVEREKVFGEFEALDRQYPRPQATVKDLVDHIDYVVRLIGIDHVGIGTDFDGGGGIAGCDDVIEIPNITLELLRRGYAEREIAKIWGGNFMRIFRQAREFSRGNDK